MTSIFEAATVIFGVTTAAGAVATVHLARSRAAVARGHAALVEQNTTQSQLLAAAGAKERALHNELRHLLKTRLPARALKLISDHYPVPGLLSSGLAGTEYAQLLDAIEDLFVSTTIEEQRRINSAARAALRGTCMEIQAKAYQLQTLLVTLQRECQDEATLKSLLELDHHNEQIARLVQKAAIVSGAWPGLVRPDTHLPEIVTGAMSRLHGYERIQINSKLLADNVGVVGSAAEPLAVAAAELFANALESSRSDLSVEVTLLQTDNGTVCIQIDDQGKGMTTEAAARGTRLVSGENPQAVLLTELGDPPALGFPAIGQLVADHGFQVSVDQVSAYRGVRAVISVPPALLTTIDTKTEPLSAMAPLPAAPRHAHRPSSTAAAQAPATGTGDAAELPQRRRRIRATPSAGEPRTLEAQLPDPDKALRDWEAYEQGVASGRADTAPTTDPKDNT